MANTELGKQKKEENESFHKNPSIMFLTNVYINFHIHTKKEGLHVNGTLLQKTAATYSPTLGQAGVCAHTAQKSSLTDRPEPHSAARVCALPRISTSVRTLHKGKARQRHLRRG